MKITKISLALCLTLALVQLSACGKQPDAASSPIELPITSPIDGSVVKARATLELSVGDSSPAQGLSAGAKNTLMVTTSGSQSISTTLSPLMTFTLSNSLFSVPANPTPNAIDDFGFLQLTALADNTLDVCGTNSTNHCGNAIIRAYTTGTAGAGLWNTTDAFGAPITMGNSTLATVGLNVAGALALQQLPIPSTKHTVNLADFPNPKYDVKVNFTNAGAGAYSTTLVIEYVLTP
jgi:hypothetical protein